MRNSALNTYILRYQHFLFAIILFQKYRFVEFQNIASMKMCRGGAEINLESVRCFWTNLCLKPPPFTPVKQRNLSCRWFETHIQFHSDVFMCRLPSRYMDTRVSRHCISFSMCPISGRFFNSPLTRTV